MSGPWFFVVVIAKSHLLFQVNNISGYLPGRIVFFLVSVYEELVSFTSYRHLRFLQPFFFLQIIYHVCTFLNVFSLYLYVKFFK